MPSPILARADALMYRRRQGETGPLDDVPVLTDIVEDETNIPRRIDPATPSRSPEASPGTAPPQDIAALTDLLSQRLRARIEAELPRLIAETVAEILDSTARTPPSEEPPQGH